jgi:hypothetical protein
MLDETRVSINFLESLRIEDGMVVVDGVRASAMKTTGVCACNLIYLFSTQKGRRQDIRTVPRGVVGRLCSHFPSREV